MKQILFSGCLLFSMFFGISVLEAQPRTLNYYIEQAVQHNTQILDQQAAIDSTQLDIEIAKAQLARPLVTGTADYLYAPVYGKYGFDPNVTDGGFYAALLNMEYPVLHYRRLSSRTLEGEAAQQKSRDNIRQLEHEIETNVTGQYIIAYQNLSKIQYLNDSIALLVKQQNLLKSLVQKGMSHITDLQQIDIEIRDLRIQLSTAQNEYIASVGRLNVICGIEDSLDVQLRSPVLAIDSTGIDNSRFLEGFRLDSLQLSVQEKAQDMQYRPTLSLTTSLGLNSSRLSENPGLEYNYGYSVGLHFSAILYDGHQKDLNRQKITIARRSVQDHRTQFIKERNTNLQMIRQQIQGLNEQLNEMDAQNESYADLLNTYNIELTNGELSVVDYLTVLRRYLESRNRQDELEANQMQLINEYNYWHW